MNDTASTGQAQALPSGLKPWKPGQSGNPKGRAKAPVDIAALAREHGPRCVQIAAELLDSDDERIRLAAAQALLERGFGKPTQPIGGDPDNPLTVSYVVRAPQIVADVDEWLKLYAPKMSAGGSE